MEEEEKDDDDDDGKGIEREWERKGASGYTQVKLIRQLSSNNYFPHLLLLLLLLLGLSFNYKTGALGNFSSTLSQLEITTCLRTFNSSSASS